MEKKEIEKVFVRHIERVVEHKDNWGNLLYTETIKEPVFEVREKVVTLTEAEVKFVKIENLKTWFDTIYRCQVEQATRAQFFNEPYNYQDKLRDKSYSSLSDLYNEGRLVQQEIRALS